MKSSSNPVIHRQLDPETSMPGTWGASTAPLTVGNVASKSWLALAFLIAGAVIGWHVPMGIAVVAAIIAFGLGLFLVFKRTPLGAGSVLTYAVIEGVTLGAVSAASQARYPGIVLAALSGTVVAFLVVLIAFMFGLRANPKITRIVGLMAWAYIAYLFVSLGIAMFTGFDTGSVSVMGIPLGAILGSIAVGMGVYYILVDFTDITQAVHSGASENLAWTLVFGLMLSIIWVYIELLRVLRYVWGD